MGYENGDFCLEDLLPAIGRAEDRLARLDERVARSAIREGFIERGHFFDAAASLWLAGDLVHFEDLVLHDAAMDVRAPTHELTRAHAILRARRRLWREGPRWGTGPGGLAALLGREAAADVDGGRATLAEDDDESALDGDSAPGPSEGAFAAELAELDAAIAAADRLLEGGKGRPEAMRREQAEAGFPLYDPDWDEDGRLAAWRAVMDAVGHHPPALAGAILWEAWERIEPSQHRHWLGALLVGAYLRARGKVASHLFGLCAGLRTIPRERRRSRSRTERIAACLDGMAAAAEEDLETLNRLHLARSQIEHRLRGRRTSSSLPAVVDLLFSRPVVSAAMIAKFAKVTPRGALNLIAELGVREMTGRGRYRAWGIIA